MRINANSPNAIFRRLQLRLVPLTRTQSGLWRIFTGCLAVRCQLRLLMRRCVLYAAATAWYFSKLWQDRSPIALIALATLGEGSFLESPDTGKFLLRMEQETSPSPCRLCYTMRRDMARLHKRISDEEKWEA